MIAGGAGWCLRRGERSALFRVSRIYSTGTDRREKVVLCTKATAGGRLPRARECTHPVVHVFEQAPLNRPFTPPHDAKYLRPVRPDHGIESWYERPGSLIPRQRVRMSGLSNVVRCAGDARATMLAQLSTIPIPIKLGPGLGNQSL